MVRQNNHGVQTESRASMTKENVTSKNSNNSAPVISLYEDVHTLEKIITGRVRNEVDSVMATVETRVHDAILNAMDTLVFPGVDLAMKSVNVSSRRDIGSVVPDPNQRVFSENIEG